MTMLSLHSIYSESKNEPCRLIPDTFRSINVHSISSDWFNANGIVLGRLFQYHVKSGFRDDFYVFNQGRKFYAIGRFLYFIVKSILNHNFWTSAPIILCFFHWKGFLFPVVLLLILLPPDNLQIVCLSIWEFFRP